MAEIKKIYSYLGDLERRIRVALTSFVFLFLLGTFIAGIGIEKIRNFTASTRPELLTLFGVVSVAVMLALMIRISKASWVEEFHLRIDKSIFGFLQRTNEIIFGALAFALKPEERTDLDKMEATRQNLVVQSIFASLSNDTDLFENFLKTKIFRNWTMYWIMVYGTITFLSLTILSFVFVALGLDPYAKMLFTIYWLLTALHLGIVLSLGHRLVRMSKRAVDSMVASHKGQIADTLRRHMHVEEEDVEEADVIMD